MANVRTGAWGSMLCAIALLYAASSAFGQDAPFPAEESARLTAEIRKSPENDELRRDLIDLLRERGRRLRAPSEAIYKLLQSAAVLQDTDKPEDLTRAIALYKRVANSVPWYVSVYMDLGLAFEKAGDWAQAKRYYDLFLYAGADYSVVPAELPIIRGAVERMEKELAKK